MTDPTRVLTLRLAGPLQSWGGTSRFTTRGTNAEPTKSGIVGMLAAAQGRRRVDPVEDLASLRLGVRIERSGVLIHDFQTASRPERKRGGALSYAVMPLSSRHYLSDAVFLVGVEGPEGFIDELAEAIRRPRYPLSLGRRSCPPAGPVYCGVAEGTLEEMLATHPWLGAFPQGLRHPHEVPARLQIARDVQANEPLVGLEREHDVPVSFDSAHRVFGWRWVKREWVDNPDAPSAVAGRGHDPFAEVG
ncbi:MAG: type I-E CRISPR-associated protein Cas5/CasD [Nostocoides sp.]